MTSTIKIRTNINNNDWSYIHLYDFDRKLSKKLYKKDFYIEFHNF